MSGDSSHATPALVKDPPTIREKYSGIPERLLDKARKSKQQLFQNQSKTINSRVRLPVVPQGVSQAAFNAAIAELRSQLGDANVVLNDHPLDDGW